MHSLTLLIKVCNALGVSTDYLLQNEYSNPTSGIETELMHVVKDMPIVNPQSPVPYRLNSIMR